MHTIIAYSVYDVAPHRRVVVASVTTDNGHMARELFRFFSNRGLTVTHDVADNAPIPTPHA